MLSQHAPTDAVHEQRASQHTPTEAMHAQAASLHAPTNAAHSTNRVIARNSSITAHTNSESVLKGIIAAPTHKRCAQGSVAERSKRHSALTSSITARTDRSNTFIKNIAAITNGALCTQPASLRISTDAMHVQAASQHAQIGAVRMRADIQTTADNIMLLWIGGKGNKTVHLHSGLSRSLRRINCVAQLMLAVCKVILAACCGLPCIYSRPCSVPWGRQGWGCRTGEWSWTCLSMRHERFECFLVCCRKAFGNQNAAAELHLGCFFPAKADHLLAKLLRNMLVHHRPEIYISRA